MLFLTLPIGYISRLPLSVLTPTQSDDGYPSTRVGGRIEACADRGRILIIHGHHQYYKAKATGGDGDPYVLVKKVVNPFTDNY